MIAGFHLDWGRNVYLTLKHCNRADELDPAPDEAIRIRVLRAAALAHEAATVAGASATFTQLEFRAHTAAADAAALAVARGRQKLFAGMRAAVVNFDDALRIAREVMRSYESAVEHYKAALVLLPSSAATMRAYAAVLSSVYDRAGAAEMLAAADAAEETRSKQSARVFERVNWVMPMTFDVALETNAVIQVCVWA